VEHVGDVAGGPGSHGVGAAIFGPLLFLFFRTLLSTLPPYLRLPLLQQRARSGFSFYLGGEEAVQYHRLRRLNVECSCGRVEGIEAA